MIIKKLKRAVFKKPKATMIGNLVDYVLAPQDENGDEKMTYAGAKNFLARTAAGQKREMIALASESIQSKMPVAHWIMSWQGNEQPSNEQIDEAVDVFLKRMELEGHQVIYALHNNTGNCHVHIVVNRTHPDTLKVIQPHKGFDIEEAHRIAAWLEHTQGWASQNKARYRVDEKGEIVRNIRRTLLFELPQTVKPTPKAEDFENATGEKSAQRIAQERGHSIIKNAQSWPELHEKMAQAGLRFEKKGSGAIVFVGDIAVKASSVDRSFGLSKLCKRLGDYEPGSYAPDRKTPEAQPVSPTALEQWREYRKVCADEAVKAREEEQRQADIIFRAKVTQHDHRKAALSALARHGIHILNIARHFLKVQQKNELAELRQAMPRRKKPPRFKAWLQAGEFMRVAALWRFRRRVKPDVEVARPEFPRVGDMASPYLAYRELLLKKYPDKMDASRLDAAIALWMRVTGYTNGETAGDIYKNARSLRQEHRNWKNYVRRNVWYAFGSAGDIDIAAFQPTPEIIHKFYQEAERIEAARLAPEPPKEAETVWSRPRMR